MGRAALVVHGGAGAPNEAEHDLRHAAVNRALEAGRARIGPRAPGAGAGDEARGPANLKAERQDRNLGDEGHGTVGAVAVDEEGHTAVAVSTGGVAFKLPGRLGDSALPGAGFYADDGAGAVCATGR